MRAPSQRVEQPGIQHGSVCVLDEVKLEREVKQSSEMVDRRENESSSDQMKADGRGIDRTSGPFRAGFQKKSCQSNQFTKNLPFQKCPKGTSTCEHPAQADAGRRDAR